MTKHDIKRTKVITKRAVDFYLSIYFKKRELIPSEIMKQYDKLNKEALELMKKAKILETKVAEKEL